MLLESVPTLHGGRDAATWADRAGRCFFHERYPEADAEAPASDDNPIMAEIEPGHFVTCAHVDESGGCAGHRTRAA